MTRARLALILGTAIAIFLVGFQAGSCRNGVQVSRQVQQADVQRAQGDGRLASATAHDRAAAAARPVSQAHASEAAQLRAEIARLRVVLAQAPTPDLAPLVAKQDDLIQTQAAELASTQTELAETAAARDDYRSAAGAFRAEADALRGALAHLPRNSKNTLITGYNPATQDALVGYTRRIIGPVEVGGMAVWQERHLGAYILVVGRW